MYFDLFTTSTKYERTKTNIVELFKNNFDLQKGFFHHITSSSTLMLNWSTKHRRHKKWCYLRRVYTSRLRMRFPHWVAFPKYLPWFIYVYGTKHYYFENTMQCGKRISKRDVATRLYLLGLTQHADISRWKKPGMASQKGEYEKVN